MTRGRLYLVAPLVALGLFGCRAFNFEERAPWRAEAEAQCIAQRLAQPTAYAAVDSPINGPGVCGMNHPFKIEAAADGFVGVQPKATLACPMTAAFNKWLTEVVQPAAHAWFGEHVVEVKQLSSFSCRRIGGSGTMSEHGFGNALDVAGFTFQSGRSVTVKRGWRGSAEERGFLRQVHAGGCDIFTTVLGPGYDAAHHDHFHFDLARRNRVVCRPAPQPVAAPPLMQRNPENIPMSQHRAPERFPIARAPQPPQVESDYEEDDAPTPQRFPVARAPRQPLPPEQAYPPAHPPRYEQPNPPLVLNPQDPSSYPPPSRGPGPYAPPAYRPEQPPAPVQTFPPSPNRMVPPGRVGKLKSDPTVTGSIRNRKHYKDTPEPAGNLPKALPGED
jgi:hypothetical protein